MTDFATFVSSITQFQQATASTLALSSVAVVLCITYLTFKILNYGKAIEVYNGKIRVKRFIF